MTIVNRDPVSKLRVQSFALSIDGCGAGPNQDLQNPLGLRGPELMEWFFHTRVWRKMHGHDDGETDDALFPEIFVEELCDVGKSLLGLRRVDIELVLRV